MFTSLLGLFMLVSVASAQTLPEASIIAGGTFKTMIECKDRELGVLMTLSQWIDSDGIPGTVYRITSIGQDVPKFFNRTDDRSEQQLRKVFSAVCLRVLTDPSILDGGIR